MSSENTYQMRRLAEEAWSYLDDAEGTPLYGFLQSVIAELNDLAELIDREMIGIDRRSYDLGYDAGHEDGYDAGVIDGENMDD